MMKRLMLLLLTVLLLPAAMAESNVYDLIENAMYRIVLRTEEEDIPLGSGVLFIENQVLLTAAGCVQTGDLYAIGTDGEFAITQTDVLDDSGAALLELEKPSANTPLHMANEEATGMACIFGTDGTGEFIVAPLNQLRDTVYHNQEALLLSSAEGLLPGAFLTDDHGNLIGLTIAQQGEGTGAYLALDANVLYRAMTRQQYADAFLPVDAAYANGILTLTWDDEERTEGMYLITLSADENQYYTFFQAPYTDRSIDINVAPGHRYDFQVQWAKDKDQAMEPVWGAMSGLIVPQASFVGYDYVQTIRLVTRTASNAPIVDLPETTLAQMTDPGMLHYLQVDSAYDVEEAVELPMTIELIAPDGQSYMETAQHVLSPKKEQNHAFLLPLDGLLADCTEFTGGTLALGQYTLRYALAGGVAGEYTFTITARSATEIAAEQAAKDAEAAAEAEKNKPKNGFVTQLTADYKNGAVALSWPAEEIPEGATVDAFFLYEGNSYYTYYRMPTGENEIELFTVPGRETMLWIYWTLDPSLEMTMPHHQGDFLVIPAAPEAPFTLHGFTNQRLSLASSQDALAVDRGEYLPETALTRDILTDESAYLYFQTEDTYQVTEISDEHPMQIVLCTPEGLCFADPLIYMFDPALQTSDLWLKDISNLCRDYERLICGAWPAGDYRILYCIDGQVAGEINFTLE